MASDKDVGPLYYYIEDTSHIFTINNTTGVITTNDVLDYEGVRQFHFTVVVSDLIWNVSENCNITLSDVNDNAPRFVAGCCNNVSITESTAVGTLLPVTINVTDDDSGPNGEVTLSQMFSFIDKFELLQNGSINVTGVLDYETQSRYTLVILATDNAPSENNKLSSSITIVVQLKNENDNDPSFNSSVYEFIMVEHAPSGTIVGQVIVSDADGDSLTLSVMNELYFAVNSSGIVTTNGGMFFFNYDKLPIKYHFSIIASDGSRIDRTNVVVTLIDDNDHSPVFTQDYNTTLGIGSYSNQPLLALVALDEDSTDNGRISYSIQSDSSGGLFTLNNATGLLAVNGNFTSTMVYSLEVLAMDHGNPPRDDVITVTVNVIQLSDSVQFNNASYSVNIFENITTNDEILMVSTDY